MFRASFNLEYITFTQYNKRYQHVHVAFKPQVIVNTLGEYISDKGLKQLRIAETEKYAHVTFFFNGGIEQEYPGEDRILVQSPKVATYDLQPEMSADEVGNKLLKAIQDNPYDLIILNFANADMVGQTGHLAAAIKAVETVDRNLGKIIDKITEIGGKAIITADHGNAEKMINPESGKPFTAHSTNKVPLIIVGEDHISLESEGRLSDIASTLLMMMDMEPPLEFTGKSLFKREE